MINLNLQVRHAATQDYRQISNLIFHEANTHRHLDWRSALEWLGAQNYWVLEDQGNINAAFACPEDPSDVAWIRLFAHHPRLPLQEAWPALWEFAHAEMFQSNPRVQVAAIVLKQWFQNTLLASGFDHRENIVVLRLYDGGRLTAESPQGVTIRSMQADDLEAVTQLDRAAFGSFWANSLDSLKRAFSQAVHATVAEDGTGLIGYQLSTGNPFGAHLARLGVRPEAQGRGVGTALLNELIRRLDVRSSFSLSVNTQSTNTASMALYQKMGFVRTGEYFPVFSFENKSAV